MYSHLYKTAMDMKPKWLIEHSFGDDTDRLIATLDDLEVEYKILSNPAYMGNWKYLYPQSDCVVTYGSIQFGNMVQRECDWIPGHWDDKRLYRCSYYYPLFGDYLLNSEYVMLPYGDLPRRQEWLFNVFGREGTIFVRPDSGHKTFTGQTIYRERFAKDYDILGHYGADHDAMCLISTPKNIAKEWRFVVGQEGIITGSQYREFVGGILGSKYKTVQENEVAWNWARMIVNTVPYQPHPVWTLDICQTVSGNWYVLEVGGFSSAGLYCSDPHRLVEAVNRAALTEYMEYYSND